MCDHTSTGTFFLIKEYDNDYLYNDLICNARTQFTSLHNAGRKIFLISLGARCVTFKYFSRSRN